MELKTGTSSETVKSVRRGKRLHNTQTYRPHSSHAGSWSSKPLILFLVHWLPSSLVEDLHTPDIDIKHCSLYDRHHVTHPLAFLLDYLVARDLTELQQSSLDFILVWTWMKTVSLERRGDERKLTYKCHASRHHWHHLGSWFDIDGESCLTNT